MHYTCSPIIVQMMCQTTKKSNKGTTCMTKCHYCQSHTTCRCDKSEELTLFTPSYWL